MQAPSLLLLPDRSSAEIHMTDLSDQTLMEALIEQTSDEFKKPFLHPSGRYLPVCRWPGVKCNARRRVVEIAKREPAKGIDNVLDIAFLPPRLNVIYFPANSNLHGSVCTRTLPASLGACFFGGGNFFHGNFDFRYLPPGLTLLSIRNNQFSGCCDLAHLPKHLAALDAAQNYFTGSLHLSKLPISLRTLTLGTTDLSGAIDLRNLPHLFESLNLTDSRFYGEVCLDFLPITTKAIYLSYNRLFGSIHAAKLPSSLEVLDLRFNEFTGVAVISTDMLPRVKYESWYISGVADENGKVYKSVPQVFNDLWHMMEFVEKLDNDTKRSFASRSRGPLPLKLWKGLELSSWEVVLGIQITESAGYRHVKGTFAFDKLPRKVTSVEIGGYRRFVTGSIETMQLPKLLQELKVSNNDLDGDFEFEGLPMSLVTLDISHNRFGGPVALDQLPVRMENLLASGNYFGGSLDLTNLPKTLRTLHLAASLCEGPVNFNLLPASLEELDLRQNDLGGRVRMTRVPPSLIDFRIDGNRFEGTAVLSRSAPNGIWRTFEACFGIEAVVDTDGVPFRDW